MNELYKKIEESDIKSVFFAEKLYEFNFRKKYLKEMLDELVMNNEIIHIQRNVYILGRMLRKELPSEQILSNLLIPNSYVSMEYLLSRISWIPENVYVVTCVTNEKPQKINTYIGNFRYINLPQNNYVAGIDKCNEGNYYYFKARPLKALADIVCNRKHNWTSLHPLIYSLRIEEDDLKTFTSYDFEELDGVYRDKNVNMFLDGIRKELLL